MDRESHTTTRGPRACTTCAKAKARCIAGPTEGTCERCHRLNKLCAAQTPAPPRKRKTPKPTRVADLERRLQDLTARVGPRAISSASPDADLAEQDLLPPPTKRIDTGPPCLQHNEHHRLLDHVFAPEPRPSEQAGHRTARNELPPRNDNLPSLWRATYTGGFPLVHDYGDTKQPIPRPDGQDPDKSYTSSSTAYASSTQSRESGVRPGQRNPSATAGSGHEAPPVAGDAWYYPSSLEADQLLDHFRAHMACLFPFVVHPPSMTSAQLRAERPLLWKATMTASLHADGLRQLFLGRELLNDIVAAAYLQPKKSYDILQALMTLIAWYHIILKSFQMTNLLFLMRSICISLGINESLGTSEPQAHSSASLDHMRTYAGVYYLVTMVFTTNKKHDAFMNTSYLTHCCRTLEDKMEYPSDQLAVLLVRTQQISQSISMTLAFRNNNLPMTIIVQSFQHEIDQLRASIVAADQNDPGLHMQLKVAEILLYEPGLSEEVAVSLTPPERLEMLWKCLQATRAMLDLRFAQQPPVRIPELPHIPLMGSDYTFAMLTCLRLSTLNLPGWDLRLVRSEMDFNKYLELQHQVLQAFIGTRRETLLSGGGVGADGQDGKHSGRGRTVPPGYVDPFDTLQIQIGQLGAIVKAELAATMPPGVPPPPTEKSATSGEDLPAGPGEVGSGSRGTEEMVGKGEAAAEVAAPAPEFRDDLDDIMQTFHQSFWQDMDRVGDDVWGMNFNSLMWSDVSNQG